MGGNPKRGQASWHQDPTRCLRWQADGQLWRPTTLAKHIIKQATGRTAAVVRGPAWWVTETGDDLVTLAESVADSGTVGRFDWALLHRIMARLPGGRWTTYGDLAQVIGTAPLPVGNHYLHCADCANRERVLQADGRLAEGFRWSEQDRTDDPRRLLEDQGVHFDASGRADPSQRLRLEELAQYTETTTDDPDL